MMHFVRLTFLILSLGVVGFVWAYGAHPEWVGRVDRWFCDRHLADTEQLWARVQSTPDAQEPDGLHRDVASHLAELGDVRQGERRFTLWRNLVLWYVGEARKWGELDLALEWQARLMATTPPDVHQRMAWVQLLIERRRPSDLKQARELVTATRMALPDWQPAIAVDLRLAWLEEDWDRLVESLAQWQAGGGEDLVSGWQWYHRPAEAAKLKGSPRMDSKPSMTGPQRVVQWNLPNTAQQAALRVDPPAKSSGRLVNVKFFGVEPGGVTTELKAKQARQCEWVEGSGELQLKGEGDPRIELQVPAHALTSVFVQFETRQATPPWILQDLDRKPELSTRLEQAGLLEATR